MSKTSVITYGDRFIELFEQIGTQTFRIPVGLAYLAIRMFYEEATKNYKDLFRLPKLVYFLRNSVTPNPTD